MDIDEHVTIAITIGGGLEFGLTNKNNLVLDSRYGNARPINLGPYTKKRCADLKEYLDRLAIHVPES